MRILTRNNKPVVAKEIGSITNALRSSKEMGREEALRTIANAMRVHPWSFATVDAVTRSIIGTGWTFVPVEEFKSEATKKSLNRIKSFFEFRERKWDNIKDFIGFPDKMAQTIADFRAFGHIGWEIIRDGTGNPIGFDVLNGIVTPQVNDAGYFKNPAFKLIPWENPKKPVFYKADEVAYFYNPGITGKIGGETIYESLSSASLPADLYAAIAFREVFKNNNAPHNGVWEIDPDVSDEDFDLFLSLLEKRYSGAENYGRNPLVVRGSATFKEYRSKSEDDAPYLEGRNFNREEYYGVTGVDGNKLGVSDNANKSNIRETRREFHENVLRPMFARLEENIYYQVFVRLFGVRGWKLKFNQPDITTALEQATIDMRNIQWGVESPNEVRIRRGQKAREGGDVYYMPLNMAHVDEDGNYFEPGAQGDQGNDGDSSEGDNGSSTPNKDDVRAPRDDENPDSVNVLKELKTWRKFYLKMMDGKKPQRDFNTKVIPAEFAQQIKDALDVAGNDFALVKQIFDIAEDSIYEGTKA